MSIGTTYRIHKWFAVPIGAFLLVWLISGIVMVLPPISLGPEPMRQAPTVDFRDVKVSPAQAVANLENALETSSAVNSVSLKRIQNVVVYEIYLRNGEQHLVNAVSGQAFAISPDLAARFVLDTYPREGRIQKVERVERHSYAYQWGPLPAYRVVFDGGPSVDFYVAANDGAVRRSDRWNRLQGAVGSLHTFEPLKLITKQDLVRRGSLVLFSSLGIVVAVTGYYLALGRRRSFFDTPKTESVRHFASQLPRAPSQHDI